MRYKNIKNIIRHIETRYNNFEDQSLEGGQKLQLYNKIYPIQIFQRIQKSWKNQKVLSIFNNEATSQVLQTRYPYRNLYANQNQKDIKSLSILHRSIIHDLWPT